MLTNKERFDALDLAIAEGRVLRNMWTDDSGGRSLVCLLAGISPEAGAAKSAAACPAAVVPAWFAHMTQRFDDNVSLAYWPTFLLDYARIVRRAAETLTPEQWERVGYGARAIVLRVALRHACKSTPAVAAVLALCEREARGEVVSRDEWPAARVASDAAYAAHAAAYAADAAAYAAHAAHAADAADAADAAAYAAAYAADAVAYAAYVADAAAYAAARSKAWDEMARGVLAAIEAACEKGQN